MILRDLALILTTKLNLFYLKLHIIWFLSLLKTFILVISPLTFSMQLGAGTAYCCLFQCAISFCTL